jgi:LPS-assembly protein
LSWRCGIFLLFFLVLSGRSVLAQNETDNSSPPIQLEATELVFDQKSGTYRAEQDVVLRKGEQRLQADRVEFHEASGLARAFGHVLLAGSEGVVTGEELSLNLEQDTGTIRNGRIFLPKPNFHVAGAEIEKLGKYRYRVQNGSFTTCDGDRPSWKFTARQVDVTVGGYAWARHVFFHIYDIPVFYLPVIGYPAKIERESGLLMPRFGQSDRRGTELSLVYYQVLGRNMDATFYLDYFSRMGVGKGVEYRYFLGHDNEGEAKLYHVSGLQGHSDQVAIDWRHMGTLPGQIRLTTDVQYVSSRRYFSDYGEVVGEYNRDRAESVVAASRHWGKNNLTAQVKYLRRLVQDDEDEPVNDDLTVQRLPDVRFAMLRRRFGYSPFYFRFDSSAAYLWQRKGLKVGRLSVRPAFSAQFVPGGWLELGAEVGYRERFYSSSEGGEHKGVPDASVRLATRMSRVYAVEGESIRKVQHVIQPEVTYQYIPAVNQDDLPWLETADFIGRRNTVSYGLVNRLVARQESSLGTVDYRELLYLRLAQEYDISPSQHDLLDPVDRQEERWSDVRTELIVRPTRSSYLDLDSRVATSGGSGLRTFHVEGGVEDGLGNGLALRYRYYKDYQEYVGAKVDMAWLKPVYVKYEQRYSLQDSVTLENVLDLEYRAQCWSVFFTWRDRRDEQEFTISFALTGIGRASHLGSRVEPDR